MYLEQLSEEQRAAVIAEALEHNAQQQQQAAPQVNLPMPDGTIFQGTAEEAAAKLSDQYAQIQQLQQEQANPQQAAGQQQTQQWNQNEWADIVVKDAPKAFETYFDHALGFQPKAGFEAITQAITILNDRIQNLDTGEWAKTNNIPAQHRDHVTKLAQERFGTVTQDTLQDAYILAQGRGELEETAPPSNFPQATQQPTRTPNFNVPSRVAPGTGGNPYAQADPNVLSEADKAEFNKIAEGMSAKELGDYLQANAPQRNLV